MVNANEVFIIQNLSNCIRCINNSKTNMLSYQIHFFRMYMNKSFLIMNGVYFDNENKSGIIY